MANYRVVASRFPAVREYMKHRRWSHRGDVLAYSPNLRAACFSTDAVGFRHSVWRGREYGIETCENGERYGLVLGSSHIFGFGLPGNRDTLPSQLSELLGFPCLNVSFPEADTRTLFATLLRVVTQSATKPSLVVFFNGGDLTRYCYTAAADPLFGCPSVDALEPGQGPAPDEAQAFRNLGFFVRLWTRQMIGLTQRAGIPFCFATDSTFFEKEDFGQPDAIEVACELGVPRNAAQAERFAIHRRRVRAYGDIRVAVSEEFGIAPPLYDPGIESFIDEFHFRAESLGLMAERVARQMEGSL